MSEALSPVVGGSVSAGATPNAAVTDGLATPETTPAATLSAEAPKVDAPVADPAKPAEEPKKEEPANPVVPEKYELKLGEKSVIPASRIDEIAAEAKAAGLTNEQAQSLLAREEKAASDYLSREVAAYQQRQSEWQNAVKADPEMGGENYNQTLVLANRVVERFGSEALRKDLQSTGLGNHPELVRIFAAMGKQLASDTFVQPGNTPTTARDVADIFYGTKK